MLQTGTLGAPRLLILAGDDAHARPFVDALARRGVAVRLAPGAGALLRSVEAETPDAVLLMPAAHQPDGGTAAVRRLRGITRIPCVLVAAPEDGPEDRAAAIEAGADEVLHSGIPLPEAIARIQAVLRRSGPRAAAPAAWRLVENGRRLLPPDGEPLRLTTAEFGLLALLVGAGGAPVERETVSRQVFRRPWNPEDRAVDSLVKRLRPRLPADAIQSVRGIGYALTLRIEHLHGRV